MDSFGNYVAQRLIEAAGPEARLAIGRLLAPAMLELSKHQYGCRVVQNAIQVSARIITTLPCAGFVLDTLERAAGIGSAGQAEHRLCV